MMNAALVWGLSNTKITRPSNIYIVNLAAADFMIITVLPFMHTEIKSSRWNHGPFLCKMLYRVVFRICFFPIKTDYFDDKPCS